MIDRSWARTTSPDRSAIAVDARGRLGEPDAARGCTAAGHPVGAQLRGDLVDAPSARSWQSAAYSARDRRRRGTPRPRPAGRPRGCCAARGRAARPARRAARSGSRCRARNGEERTTDSPSSAACLSSSMRTSVVARVGEQVERRVDLPVLDPAGGPAAGARDLVDDDRRLLARPTQRRAGDDGRRHQGDRAADERVGPAQQRLPGAGASAATTIDCTAAWVTQQPAGVDEQRGGHRERDDERSSATPGAHPDHEQVRDEHADRRRRGSPRRPGAAAGRRTCRGTTTAAIGAKNGCRWPSTSAARNQRDAGRDRRLPDVPALRPEPVQPRAQRQPAAVSTTSQTPARLRRGPSVPGRRACVAEWEGSDQTKGAPMFVPMDPTAQGFMIAESRQDADARRRACTSSTPPEGAGPGVGPRDLRAVAGRRATSRRCTSSAPTGR